MTSSAIRRLARLPGRYDNDQNSCFCTENFEENAEILNSRFSNCGLSPPDCSVPRLSGSDL